MSTRSSNRRELSWGFVPVIFFLLVLVGVMAYIDRVKEQNSIKTLLSIPSQRLISFKIHPDSSNPYDYDDAVTFRSQKNLVIEFLQAISDIQPYKPQHDRALAQWGMRIQTSSTVIRIGCHIPDLTPDVVAGTIRLNSGSGDFQSKALLLWYQKYGHYWKVNDYLKVQYGRVMPILNSMSPERVSSFTIVSGVSNSPEKQHTYEFVQDTNLITEFFQALEERHFAAPTFQKYLARWTVRIHAGTTTVNIECSLPAEEPTVVIGLIESDAGYTYFQSQQLLHWYQKYSHRWLEPEGAQPTPTPQP